MLEALMPQHLRTNISRRRRRRSVSESLEAENDDKGDDVAAEGELELSTSVPHSAVRTEKEK
jgi:hypothetical protein